MKNVSHIILLAGWLSIPAAASVEGGHSYSVQEKVEKLTLELNLTGDQVVNLRAVLEEQKARQEEADTDAEQRAVREETRQRVRGLLNDAQKLKYDQLKEEARRTGQRGVPALD